LGFSRSGMHTVAVVERDKNCLKLLKGRFPSAEQFDDVRSVGRDNLPECDVLCGGFPCQDLSAAGKRAGLSGARSGLFYEFARIIDECRPACVVWENVPGLFSSDRGRDFARVLLEMEKLGYSGAWRTFDARYFGVPQRRRRVFGVFALGDTGAERCAEIFALQEGMRGDHPPRREEGKEVAGTLESRTSAGGFPGTDGACAGHIIPFDTTQITHPENAPAIAFSCKDSGADAGDLSPTLRSMNFDKSHLNGGGQVAVAFKPSHFTRGKDGAPSETFPPLSADADKGDQDPVIFQSRIARNGRGQPEDVCPALNGSNAGATSDMRPLVASSEVVRRLTPTECERLQGFNDGWTEGFSDSVRYRMLGNAVCVNVAEWIGKRIMRFAKEE
jgi:DNA (cytosine-5)-methyltransferase 1